MLDRQAPMAQLPAALFAVEAAVTQSQACPARQHQTCCHSSTEAAVMSKSPASAVMAAVEAMSRLLPTLRLVRLKVPHQQQRVHHPA